MSDETKQSRPVDDALLQEAVIRMKTRGESVSRLGCMQLSAPIFNELCRQIVASSSNGGRGIDGVAEWLASEIEDAPSRSAVYRFARYLLEDYRIAQLHSTRAQAENFVSELAAGSPDALQMALTQRATELLTDFMMRQQSLDDVDTDKLAVVMAAIRSVAQTAFDKQKMDARIKALEKMNQERDLRIAKLDQTIAEYQRKQKEAAAALANAEAQAKSGSDGAAVVTAIKQALGIIKGAA